jgi:predicted aconitase with swiveling domain
MRFSGRPLVAGTAEGEAIVVRQPLSLAGGLSLTTGHIIDVHAPQRGELVAGRILVMPVGRGSSTASTALAEVLRVGVGPAAIILPGTDLILTIGSRVARTLYDAVCPIIAVTPDDHATVRTGDRVTIASDGAISVERP